LWRNKRITKRLQEDIKKENFVDTVQEVLIPTGISEKILRSAMQFCKVLVLKESEIQNPETILRINFHLLVLQVYSLPVFASSGNMTSFSVL